ncbi:retrovirus-related pol polyprotein from transposon TNT 1-94 [Tanacetum coccineum]
MSNSNTNLQTQTSSVLQYDTVSSCSISNIQEKTQLSRSRCMHSLKEIKSLFKFLSETLQDYGTMPIFKRTFSQDLDLLEQHLTKDILSRTDCTTTLTNLKTKFENAFNSEFEERMRKYTRYNAQSFNDAMIFVKQNSCSEKEDSNSETASNKSAKEYSLNSKPQDVQCNQIQIQMTDTYFVEYTGIKVQHFRDTLLQHLGNVKKSVAERTRHKRQYERRVNKRQMQMQESKIDMGKALDADLVDTESIRTDSTVQDDNSRSGNDTDADDADIRPIYDEEPMAEVQLTAGCNIFAIGQQHTEQPEIINEGRVDQYPETCQVKSPMLDSSPDNQTTEYSKQSLESENILLKETVAQFQKDFSRMEAHCIALELKYQNQSLKSGQHGALLCPILYCLLILLQLVEIILFIVDSGCSKHMTGNLKLLTNFVEKFLGTVKFGNDQIAPILGYGDLVQGAITNKMKSTCYIRDLKGNDLLTGLVAQNLYSITPSRLSTTPNPICLMAKATSSQAWLWHRRLSHLNFDTINLLSKNNIVNGLPKLKFVKDHLCSSCERKAKRKSFHTKTTPSSKRRLQLLHMDLCGPMRVESINGKKYVLVIVDDYSRYTWTHFLRSKDETPGVLIDFLTLVQRGLHAQVTTVRTDKGTEFLNKTLHAYFAKEGIRHETSTARTPEQNGVVERRNRTLVEAARTMLSAAKVPLFFWAEAIATACFTQNRSLVIPRHEKTPYHIINARKPSVKFFHIFGSLCYIVRDGENLDKMKEKGDACIFVGYSTQSKAYRVFNKRTRLIVETIHVNFEELPQMASHHVSSDPGPQCLTTVLEQDSLGPGLQSQENVPQVGDTVTTSNEMELLHSLMFSELLNGNSPVVSKSSDVHAPDNPDKRQQHNTTHTSITTDVADPPPLNIHSTHQSPTQVPTVTAPWEHYSSRKKPLQKMHIDDENLSTSSVHRYKCKGDDIVRHVDSSNMHTFYQHPSFCTMFWTKVSSIRKSHWKSFSISLDKTSARNRWKNLYQFDDEMYRNLGRKTLCKILGGIESRSVICTSCSVEAVRLFNAYTAHKTFTVYNNGRFFINNKDREDIWSPKRPMSVGYDELSNFLAIPIGLNQKDCTSKSSAEKGAEVCVFYPRAAHNFSMDEKLSSQIMAIHFDKILCIVTSKAALASRAIQAIILVPSTRLANITSKRTDDSVMRCLTPDELEILGIESA